MKKLISTGVAGVIGVVGLGLSLANGVGAAPPRTISYDATFPSYDIEDLVAAADVVAIVQPTGEKEVHWNNSDNTEWKSETSARGAYIYRDDELRVLRVVRGQLDEEAITVRGIGGTVEDVHMHFDEQPEWHRDTRYLVFLSREETPTREGTEQMWTIVWIGHGAFEATSALEWTNHNGVQVAEGDLTE